MRTAIVVVLLALIALFFFNPGMDAFKTFIETRSEVVLREQTGEGALGRALSALGSSLAGSYVDRVTERADYLFFSTYTIDLDGPDEEGEEWRFLGMAGQFLELDRPEALEENR